MPYDSANPSTRCASAQAEARLVENIGRGCSCSFDELYRLYSGPLYSYAYKSLGSNEDAEEALQDTFVRIWNKASRYEERRSLPFTWAMMILRGICLDCHRKKGAKRRAKSVELKALHEPSVSADHTFASLHLAETTNRINKALDTLSEPERRCLKLAVFGQFSQEKIARELSTPLGTVKSRVRRSLQKIRNLLQSHDA